MLELLAKVFTSRITWIVLAVVAVVFTLQWLEHAGYERGVREERARQAKAELAVVHTMRKEHEQELRERGWLDATSAATAKATQEDLNNRLAELVSLPPKTLLKTVVIKDESGCSHPNSTLGDAFWLRYRAAGDNGGTADPGAASGVQPGVLDITVSATGRD